MAYEYPKTDPKHEGWTFCADHHDTYPSISPLTASVHSQHSVLITGASKGIGHATALSFARAGASQIAIAARSPLAALREAILSAAAEANHPAPAVLALEYDQLDPASVARVAARVEAEFGRLDVLVNNAGVLESFAPVAESDQDAYWRTWEVNYRGVYWLTKALLPLLARTKDGLQTVLNIGSIGSLVMLDGSSGYAITKMALLRLAEYVSSENAKNGVVAYTVHPGGVMTELSRAVPEDMYHFLGDTPELAADTIAFLTQEKRTWLAGRYVSCNWDMQEFLAKKDDIVAGDKLKLRLVV